jgi:hypothetical protein
MISENPEERPSAQEVTVTSRNQINTQHSACIASFISEAKEYEREKQRFEDQRKQLALKKARVDMLHEHFRTQSELLGKK